MKIKVFLLFAFCIFASCATYQSKIWESRNFIKQGQIQESLEKLKPLSEAKSDDQLVYLYDYGTALQIAGNYNESNTVFLKADKLAESLDYHSVSNVTMATLGSEEMVQYKGESYEKILVNTMLATNYLMLGLNDEALVEVRRINEKITKYRLDGRKDYEQNPYGHFLGGLIWESDRKYDDAYISFYDSYKLDPTNPFIAEDLVRMAKKSQRMEEYKKWKQIFPHVLENPDWYNKEKGELVIIYQQGWGPEKHFSPVDQRFPKLYPISSQTAFTKLRIENQTEELSSKMVYHIEKDVVKTLDDDVAWMIARKVGSTVAKAVVADQIRQKNEALGDLAWIFMRISDRADLRQWSTLPRSIQMIRVWLPKGEYKISLQGYDGSGVPTADQLSPQPIKINASRKTFYNYRSLR